MKTNAVAGALEQKTPSQSTFGKWLDEHPIANKIVVLVNHIFRAVGMFALMAVLPFSLPINCALGLGASLFYRYTIERFCHFKFAIPACLGGMALHLTSPSLHLLIYQVASQAMASVTSLLSAVCLTLYALKVIWISNRDVDAIKPPINPIKAKSNIPQNNTLATCCCG